ncbi:MAG: phosphoribosylanthranilate isomerase [Desulfobulbaceae bacterium]|jgi:phosphoribosylanthranilate isomerase|nr:phosphoribosylanthranilate isomerase [Desulfobulbaceae bacterium]
MTRTRIKVCGITNPDDAAMAVAAGVDALGFIFAASSPRAVKTSQAKNIIAQLPPMVDAVGVFVNQDPVELVEIIEYCGLTLVQLHGDESPDYCRKLAYDATPCRIIKAFRVQPESSESDFAPYRETVSAFLLDAWHPVMRGGSGERFDWQRIASFKLGRPCVLAGGLRPDNIALAISQAKPFAVDVNSGVEDEPGRKNQSKLETLIKQARLADAETA